MSKNTFALFGILAVLVLSLGLASAGVNYNPTTLTGAGDDGATVNLTLNIENDLAGDLSGVVITIPTLAKSGATIASSSITVSGINSATVIDGTTASSNNDLDVIVQIQIPFGQAAGVYTGNLSFNGSIGSENVLDRGAVPITLTVTNTPTPTDAPACVAGEVGTIEISEFEMSNLGEGDDDEWELLDEIEFELVIENTDRDDDVRDIIVEIFILDDSGNDVTNDFDLDEEKIDLGKISDDDEEIALFKIPEVPADIDDGDYKIYFKAYDDTAEDEQCATDSTDFSEDTYQKVEITRVDDPAVVIKAATKIVAACGDKNVEANFEVYNLGSDKEDKVLVTVESAALGVFEKAIIDGLRSGKKKDVSFTFDLPETLSKTKYDLEIMTYYDYDDDEDEMEIVSYDENSDDLDKSFAIRVEVASCAAPAPSISADLESAAEIGSELIIKATITNVADSQNDFLISVSGFESWAELVSVSPQNANINAGQSQEVIVKLNPTKEGFQTFKINTVVDGDTSDQQVQVNIAGHPSIIPGLSDTLFYIIIAIIVIILLILITLIARVSQRSGRKAEF